MKEKPILFSTPMVQAIFAGRKTMTRRVIKPKYSNTDIVTREDGKVFEVQNDTPPDLYNPETKTTTRYVKVWVEIKPKYQVGDILWVRETWLQLDMDYRIVTGKFDIKEFEGCPIEFKADHPLKKDVPWKPSIFMPRSACRLFLKVKSIRVERLQDITQSDAIDEGATRIPNLPEYQKAFDEAVRNKAKPPLGESPRERFIRLWDSLNTKRGYGWDLNPWVWVIEFEKVAAG